MSRFQRPGLTPYSYIPGEVSAGTCKRVFEVLTNIFKHLAFKDLSHARLVSRVWNNAVCNGTIFRDLCQVVLRDDADAALDFLNQAEHQFWTNFRFLTPSLDNSTQIQAIFWMNVGWNIRALSLVSHSLSPVDLLSVLGACPNLNYLTFSCKHTYGCQSWRSPEGKVSHQSMTHVIRLVENVGVLRQKNFLAGLSHLTILDSNVLPQGVLRDLLRLANKLKSLTLYDTSLTSIPLWDFGDIIRFAVENSKVLKRLELTGTNIYPEYIGALAMIKDLTLTSLHLRYAKVTDLCLLSIFKKQADLVEIDLSFTQCSQKAFLHLQCCFDKLKRLVLRGFSSNITSFAFLSRMPGLEELDISATFSTSMNWELLINSLVPLRLKKLKSLNLSFNLGLGVSPRGYLFTSLLSTFSHITCINLSQNSIIKDVFVHDVWRHLRYLRVVFLEYLPGLSTEGITGIRYSQMQNLLANGTMDKIDPTLLRYQNANGSYIGVCQGIEILSLAYNTRLNDFVIPFGIAALENLQKLKLTGCSQIAGKYFVDLIKSCKRLEYLDLTGTQIPLEWSDWAKRTNPNLRRVICNPATHASPAAGMQEQEWTGDEEVNVLYKNELESSETDLHSPSSQGDITSGTLRILPFDPRILFPPQQPRPPWKNY